MKCETAEHLEARRGTWTGPRGARRPGVARGRARARASRLLLERPEVRLEAPPLQRRSQRGRDFYVTLSRRDVSFITISKDLVGGKSWIFDLRPLCRPPAVASHSRRLTAMPTRLSLMRVSHHEHQGSARRAQGTRPTSTRRQSRPRARARARKEGMHARLAAWVVFASSLQTSTRHLSSLHLAQEQQPPVGAAEGGAHNAHASGLRRQQLHDVATSLG